MTLGIVQARVSSTRLPGKVLKPILGQPMIQRQLERLAQSERLDKLIVATSDRPDDQILASLCHKLDVTCFCGSLDDVLDRFYQAARTFKADTIVRLTGDCPLMDPAIVDEVVSFFLENKADYASNCLEPTYPDGLDVEVMSFDALKTAWREANLKSEREHVTPFIWQNPDRFKLANYRYSTDLSHLRWTVDEKEDYDLVTALYEGLYHRDPGFCTADILTYLEEHPELMQINASFERNEGFARSLAEDEVIV